MSGIGLHVLSVWMSMFGHQQGVKVQGGLFTLDGKDVISLPGDDFRRQLLLTAHGKHSKGLFPEKSGSLLHDGGIAHAYE